MRELKHEYIPGDYWMICDECGFKYRRSEMSRRWDNAWVCQKDWEPRHPQEFVRGKVDKIRVPVARPDTDTETTSDATGTIIADGTTIIVDGETIISDE